jgi:hypothetical protein
VVCVNPSVGWFKGLLGWLVVVSEFMWVLYVSSLWNVVKGVWQVCLGRLVVSFPGGCACQYVCGKVVLHCPWAFKGVTGGMAHVAE